jgi:DNA replication protein DnaC
VPLAYDVGPKALQARIHAKLWKGLAGLVPETPTGLVLLGPSGCGKSSAAAYAVQRYQARGPRRQSDWLGKSSAPEIVWLDALEATDEERRYRLGTGDPDWMQRAERADWLVIDDVGTTTSPTVVQLVLAHRYQTCRPTIMTSGLSQEALTEHIGAATVRRVLETGGLGGLLVNCHGARK